MRAPQGESCSQRRKDCPSSVFFYKSQSLKEHSSAALLIQRISAHFSRKKERKTNQHFV